MAESNDVIDLTKSFSFPMYNNNCSSNIIIDLDTDDSFCIEADILLDAPTPSLPSAAVAKSPLREPSESITIVTPSSTRKQPKLKKKLLNRKSVSPSPLAAKPGKKKFGGCPICWDELGKNPLASTKCGHVYCMKCLQEYLKVEKKCPTCRQALKGSSAYHPLYLS
ncbi:unnamed protein product [Chrysodeixis includens]|uniref:RING-type domain-containing protein n=1 Tax=Chrysodeixis includens TaxID=689277 RepID=A0A9P0BSF5_CHRIL|nr:unnamed protein product [Chrysodeixis includens]